MEIEDNKRDAELYKLRGNEHFKKSEFALAAE